MPSLVEYILQVGGLGTSMGFTGPPHFLEKSQGVPWGPPPGSAQQATAHSGQQHVFTVWSPETLVQLLEKGQQYTAGRVTRLGKILLHRLLPTNN